MNNFFFPGFKPTWSLYCLFLILSCFQAAIAEESNYDPSEFLVILSHEKSNARLTAITEDRLIIDGTPHRINHETKFYDQLKSDTLKTIPMASITLPCRVNIDYKTFSVYTEDLPYHADERLLVRVVVIKGSNQRSTP